MGESFFFLGLLEILVGWVCDLVFGFRIFGCCLWFFLLEFFGIGIVFFDLDFFFVLGFVLVLLVFSVDLGFFWFFFLVLLYIEILKFVFVVFLVFGLTLFSKERLSCGTYFGFIILGCFFLNFFSDLFIMDMKSFFFDFGMCEKLLLLYLGSWRDGIIGFFWDFLGFGCMLFFFFDFFIVLWLRFVFLFFNFLLLLLSWDWIKGGICGFVLGFRILGCIWFFYLLYIGTVIFWWGFLSMGFFL